MQREEMIDQALLRNHHDVLKFVDFATRFKLQATSVRGETCFYLQVDTSAVLDSLL